MYIKVQKLIKKLLKVIFQKQPKSRFKWLSSAGHKQVQMLKASQLLVTTFDSTAS